MGSRSWSIWDEAVKLTTHYFYFCTTRSARRDQRGGGNPRGPTSVQGVAPSRWCKCAGRGDLCFPLGMRASITPDFWDGVSFFGGSSFHSGLFWAAIKQDLLSSALGKASLAGLGRRIRKFMQPRCDAGGRSRTSVQFSSVQSSSAQFAGQFLFLSFWGRTFAPPFSK